MNDHDRLVAITEALFPGLVSERGVQVSHDIADNLEAAIYDLKRTGADEVSIRTLEKIEQQVLVARRFAKPNG